MLHGLGRNPSREVTELLELKPKDDQETKTPAAMKALDEKLVGRCYPERCTAPFFVGDLTFMTLSRRWLLRPEMTNGRGPLVWDAASALTLFWVHSTDSSADAGGQICHAPVFQEGP
jgi:hypothetical protein